VSRVLNSQADKKSTDGILPNATKPSDTAFRLVYFVFSRRRHAQYYLVQSTVTSPFHFTCLKYYKKWFNQSLLLREK
jgi:hypothetical protein